jgi:polysaccharide pyruvyl transferase WcaK-like protein
LQEIDDPEGRLFYEDSPLDHRRAKYLIGNCNFFLGARMHSCIAALSQGIPAIGYAYSDKFLGVFESVGVTDYVVDLRDVDGTAALDQTTVLWQDRAAAAATLKERVPRTQQLVNDLLNHIT